MGISKPPLRKIVARHPAQWGLIEELECGHYNNGVPAREFYGLDSTKQPQSRRCELCATVD
jgi:hypothetical protein